MVNGCKTTKKKLNEARIHHLLHYVKTKTVYIIQLKPNKKCKTIKCSLEEIPQSNMKCTEREKM